MKTYHFFQQYRMENVTVEKTVKNYYFDLNYDFVDSKAKTYYPTKKNIKRIARVLFEIFQKKKRVEKRNYADNRNKNMSHMDRKRRKKYMAIYYCKQKNLLNYLINPTQHFSLVTLKTLEI